MPVGKLAEAIGLSSAGMTTLLDRLEAKGYLQRRPDASDRRRVLVEMTDLCRQLTRRIYGPLVQVGAAVFANYQPNQLKTLREFLEKAREITDTYRRRLVEDDLPPFARWRFCLLPTLRNTALTMAQWMRNRRSLETTRSQQR